jgi:hypothetical protein
MNETQDNDCEMVWESPGSEAQYQALVARLEVEKKMVREQRRYEIARDVLAGFAADPESLGTPDDLARFAVNWADALLDALEEK